MAAAAAAAKRMLRGGFYSASLARVDGLRRAGSSAGARLHSVSFFKDMKYTHVAGQFMENDSKFVLLHLNERLNVIAGYLRTAKRHWAYPMLNLVGGMMMVTPLMLDYYELSKLEAELRGLRAEIVEAQVKSQMIDSALHEV